MASVWIVRRTTPAGASRYHVRYRLGGAASPQRYGGSFRLRRDADARVRFIRSELAGGRHPAFPTDQNAPQTLGDAADAYLRDLDASGNTTRTYRQALNLLGDLRGRDPAALRPADIQAWIHRLSKSLAPATVRKYLDPLRQVLDIQEVHPNPARSPLLRLPSKPGEEVDPPAYRDVQAILAACTPRHQLHLQVLAETGLRCVELEGLRWADVDFRGGRLRIARGRTKGGTAGRRWVPLPQSLLDDIAALQPLEDRDPEAAVFPTATNRAIGNAIRRACRDAGTAHYSPHDLRHRWISILIRGGVDPATVARVAGHSRSSVTLDVYSHVLVDEPEWVIAQMRARVRALLYPDATETPDVDRDHGGSGGYRDRTGDLRAASATLSQLS